MTMSERIHDKITAALRPARLEIIDESHLHHGHVGSRPGGETHFRVEIVSAAFAGQAKLARQRRVYDILKDEMMPGGIHALSLATWTPEDMPG
jgi:BolA protein